METGWWTQDETYPVDPAVAELIFAWDGSMFMGLVLAPWQATALKESFSKIGVAAREAKEFYESMGIITTTTVPSDRPKDKKGRPIPPPRSTGPRPNRAFNHRGRKLI